MLRTAKLKQSFNQNFSVARFYAFLLIFWTTSFPFIFPLWWRNPYPKEKNCNLYKNILNNRKRMNYISHQFSYLIIKRFPFHLISLVMSFPPSTHLYAIFSVAFLLSTPVNLRFLWYLILPILTLPFQLRCRSVKYSHLIKKGFTEISLLCYCPSST